MDDIAKLGYLSIATRFRRISERLYIDGDKIYEDHGVRFKASWFSVYYVLSRTRFALSVSELASRIDFTHITVKNVLKELERENLVAIAPNPADKRSKLIALTESGEALVDKLEPIWKRFSDALQAVFTSGHPDIINILNRIDAEIHANPINVRVQQSTGNQIEILDYDPSLRKCFEQLLEPWLNDLLDGSLENEDEFTLRNPESYLLDGGFVFFAKLKGDVVGTMAMKKLDHERFEFAKLFVNPKCRGRGIATKFIEKCVGRCLENGSTELWLQTTSAAANAHSVYERLGFVDRDPPESMHVLQRTERTMYLKLE